MMSVLALFEGSRWIAAVRPVAVISANTHSEVLPALAEVERAAQRGLTAVGFVAYEAAHGLDRAFPHAHAGLPLVWFGVYEEVFMSPTQAPLLRHSEILSLPPLSPSQFGNTDWGFKRDKTFVGGASAVFALTPSPSPTAWERGVECVRGAAGSPSPATRERGIGGEGIIKSARCVVEPKRRALIRLRSEDILWQPTLSEPDYYHALQRIRDYIAAGDVYQVNYSFRLRAKWENELEFPRFARNDKGFYAQQARHSERSEETEALWQLFWQLYHAQPVPYAAYIDTGQHVILSLSPELFFALDGERIVSRPMKGTASRGRTLEEDEKQAQSLRCSEKDRAENLMIVDMVRNDLGRIAKTGTVRVPKLFETERYATLWQMTSTVEAATHAPLTEIFRALFPAASITGAPKIRAAEVIHELENTLRGVYTGAIGIVLPNRKAQFNVAIRTLVYDRATEQLEYGVGSGVVWDSEQHAEYQECLTKAQVLLKPRPEFELLETILWRAGKGYFLLEKHLQRMRRSAEYFGFKWDEGAVWEILLNAEQEFWSKVEGFRFLASLGMTEDFSIIKACHSERSEESATFPHDGGDAVVSSQIQSAPTSNRDVVVALYDGGDAVVPTRAYRVRLLLNRWGEARVECAPLEPKPRLWRVALAPEPVDEREVFLYHKTTHRTVYEQAHAACPECEDVILWNTRGEITESTIANVVVRLNGRLYTPPISCGLLGGVYRAHLLERGWITERVITVEELLKAEAVYLVNSVRGRVRAMLH